MEHELAHLHLRVTPKTKRAVVRAAKKAGLPVTAFGEAVFATRAKDLATDPDVIAHGQQVEANRRNRNRS